MKQPEYKPCPEWEERLATTHEDDLSPSDHMKLEEHIARCPACKAVRAEYRMIDDHIRDMYNIRFQPLPRSPDLQRRGKNQNRLNNSHSRDYQIADNTPSSIFKTDHSQEKLRSSRSLPPNRKHVRRTSFVGRLMAPGGIIAAALVVLIITGSLFSLLKGSHTSTGKSILCTTLSNTSETQSIVYIGSGRPDGSVYALRARDGQKLWVCQTRGSVYSSPKLYNGVIYVGSKDMYVYAFRADNGSFLWHSLTGGEILASPYVIDGIVYIASNDGSVYAFRAGNGSLIWRYPTGAAILSSPYVINGIVYIASFDGNVYALRSTDGKKMWSYSTGKIITSSPAVVNGVALISADDDMIYALQASTGHRIWSFQMGSATQDLGVGADSYPIESSPAVKDGIIYVGSRDGFIYALQAKNGSLIWRYPTGAAILSSPTVMDGVVYIGSGDKYIYALQAKDGRLIWRYKTQGAILGSPAIANGEVYIGSQDDYIYALQASNGHLIWKYKTKGHVISLPAVR